MHEVLGDGHAANESWDLGSHEDKTGQDNLEALLTLIERCLPWEVRNDDV